MKINYLITDRTGGVSTPPYASLNIAYHVGDDPEAVRRNREIVAQKTGLQAIQYANQVHGKEVLVIERLIDPAPECDGFVTDRPGIGLAIMSADCYGVLLYDPKGIIGAVHAGRAGATLGIVTEAIKKMRSLGAQTISAVISPGIHRCCYEVSQELAKTYPPKYIQGRHLDIKALLYDQLRAENVESITDYAVCTACDRRYYSYRRDGVTGRFASIIWMEE